MQYTPGMKAELNHAMTFINGSKAIDIGAAIKILTSIKANTVDACGKCGNATMVPSYPGAGDDALHCLACNHLSSMRRKA